MLWYHIMMYHNKFNFYIYLYVLFFYNKDFIILQNRNIVIKCGLNHDCWIEIKYPDGFKKLKLIKKKLNVLSYVICHQ